MRFLSIVENEDEALFTASRIVEGTLPLDRAMVRGDLVGQFHYYLSQPQGVLKRLEAEAVKREGHNEED